MHRLFLALLLAAATLCLAVAVIIGAAKAQDYYGMGHPPPGPDHWYEPACCSNRDCEPLPDGAVTQVKGGYHVRYIGKLGFKVDVVVPFNKARPSQDHQFHGCATIDRFLCLYVPMNV